LNLRQQRIRLSGVVDYIVVGIVPVVVGMVGLVVDFGIIVLVDIVPVVPVVSGTVNISGKLVPRYLG